MNSFRSVERAIAYEIERQAAALEPARRSIQETRGWDDARGETYRDAVQGGRRDDYRYFPEPDLPPLRVDPAWLAAIRAGLPELPAARRARYEDELGLSAYDAAVIVADPAMSAAFEAIRSADPAWPAKEVANFVSGRVRAGGQGHRRSRRRRARRAGVGRRAGRPRRRTGAGEISRDERPGRPRGPLATGRSGRRRSSPNAASTRSRDATPSARSSTGDRREPEGRGRLPGGQADGARIPRRAGHEGDRGPGERGPRRQPRSASGSTRPGGGRGEPACGSVSVVLLLGGAIP